MSRLPQSFIFRHDMTVRFRHCERSEESYYDDINFPIKQITSVVSPSQ